MKFFSQQLSKDEKRRILSRIGEVIESEQFIGGPVVAEFERKLTNYFGRPTLTCNSGTDALVLALRALGVGRGDEVITSAFTYFATVEAIAAVGAKPVMADIDRATFNIDPEAIERAVTKRTKAVLVVHLFGLASDMTRIVSLCRKRKLLLLEDCAQSFGARHGRQLTGTFGDAGCFSFFPTKNLGGFGDGGAAMFKSKAVAETFALLKNHGQPRKYEHEIMGVNSRLDAVQAAVLLEKMYRAGKDMALRKKNAAAWIKELRKRDDVLSLPTQPGHTYNVFTLLVRHRAAFLAEMERRGIPTMLYYEKPAYRQKAYADLFGNHRGLVNAEFASKHAVSLPVH